jgi:hypothetical protein
VHAPDAGEVVADLLRKLARLVLHGLALAIALLLLATRVLRVALAVGFFLARDPGQVARAQGRLGTLSPHQTPSSNAPEKLPSYQEQHQGAGEWQPRIVEQEPHVGHSRV